LNEVDEATFLKLKETIFQNQLVIFKNQKALTPTKHFEFVHRFDPEALAVHGHGTIEQVKKKHNGNGSLLAAVSNQPPLRNLHL
jgi:alpha-ketoglutarate-dependent taurine dioxygenase